MTLTKQRDMRRVNKLYQVTSLGHTYTYALVGSGDNEIVVQMGPGPKVRYYEWLNAPYFQRLAVEKE